MKNISLSAEALWGLRDFLRVVSDQDLTLAFPELGVKASIRNESIREAILSIYEGSDHYKALQGVQEALNNYRIELLKPYEGQEISPEQDRELGKQLQAKAKELSGTIPDDLGKITYLLELSDEKADQLKKTYEKYGAKYLLEKRLILLIAKELGIEE